MRRLFDSGLTAVLLAVLIAAIPAQAKPQADSSGKVPITTVVTITGKKFSAPPAISKEDITVREGDNRREIVNFMPAQGDRAGLQLAIVIDDSLRRSFGNQLQSLSSFIASQPPSTSVGVFYAASGTLTVASQFNPDSAAVAKTVRMPSGTYGAASSVYQSMMQLIAGWPVTGARREILLFSDGFDYLRKDRFSPDVQLTIDKAQQAGVVIYGIFESTAGRPGYSKLVSRWGQGNLNQITDGTGGYAFFSGDSAPLSIDPYLAQFGTITKNQYFLTFTTDRSKKANGDYRGIKVVTERKDVDIKAPDKVFVPGAGGEK